MKVKYFISDTTSILLTIVLLLINTRILYSYKHHGNRTCPQIRKGERCLLSCSSRDGIGHQIEAKLSCIAVAIQLGFEYIDFPIVQTEHNTNANQLDTFFNLGHCFRKFDQKTMRTAQRKPLPWVGKCKENSWLFQAAKNLNEVCTLSENPNIVYNADNCWDQFWCDTIPKNYKIWYKKVLPIVQRSYYSTIKPNNLFSKSTINVVIHIRRGDAGYREMEDFYYIRIINSIEERYKNINTKNNKKTKIQFYIHTDMVLVNNQIPKVFTNITINNNNVIKWNFEGNITFAIHQMVSSDILVVSKSGLSYSLALIGNQSIIVPSCYDRGLLPHWIPAPCDNNTIIDLKRLPNFD